MAQLDDQAPVDAPVKQTDVDAGETLVEYNDDQTGEELEDDESDEQEIIEDDLPPIEAPVSLDAKAKELFAKLDREAQEVLGGRIAEQDRKIREVGTQLSQTRDKVYAEANSALAERHEHTAAILEQYSAAIVPQAPDPRLLYSNDPSEVAYYHRADYEHKQALAQRDAMHLEASKFRDHAMQAQQAENQQEAILAWGQASEQNPDWFDPSTSNLKPEIQAKIESIGQELGIPIDLSKAFDEQSIGYAELSRQDINAITKVMELKSDADKWRKYQADKMAGVRAAKNAPKLSKPGVAGKPQGEKSALDLLYPDD